jgi:hypothetical protein
VLDNLPVFQPVDMDLLGRELLARRRTSEEFADVAAVHRNPGNNLVALAYLVVDFGTHGPP